jgi:hypothetical protein
MGVEVPTTMFIESPMAINLSIGVCILSRVYQLNIRTPPYATNVNACFIVHSLHYMFRP